MTEPEYQAKLIKKLKKIFPGCIVQKEDSGYLQGIPDLLILYNQEISFLISLSVLPDILVLS